MILFLLQHILIHLKLLLKSIKNFNPNNIVLAERSGMGETRSVLEARGVMDLAEKEDFEVRVLDEEGLDDWVKIENET